MELQESIISEYLKMLESAVKNCDFEPIQLFFWRAYDLIQENGRCDFHDRIDAIHSTFCDDEFLKSYAISHAEYEKRWDLEHLVDG